MRLWKVELQRRGIEISVCHLPPGTSKWNRIEHRLFSFTSQNWREMPLRSLAATVSLIGATTTSAGLKVHCDVDESLCPKGVKVDDDQMAALNIRQSEFPGEWNCMLLP